MARRISRRGIFIAITLCALMLLGGLSVSCAPSPFSDPFAPVIASPGMAAPAPPPPETLLPTSDIEPDPSPDPELVVDTSPVLEASPDPAPEATDPPQPAATNPPQPDPDYTIESPSPSPEEFQEDEPVVAVDLNLKSPPVRVRIPVLKLDYEVQPTGADRYGTMEIYPALEVISWFNISSIPGNPGNAILGGHNTWRGGRSRLFTLNDMRIGDEMEIFYADGSSLTFRLESVFIYALRSAPADLIMDCTGVARVTIITCKGPYNRVLGTSDNRIVAIFKEESVFVIPDPPIIPFPPRSPSTGLPTPPRDFISREVFPE